MALIECYECGKEISSLAPACASCGAPKEDVADIVKDHPKANIPSSKNQPKSDKERVADWLIEKEESVECESSQVTSKTPEVEKKTSKPNESKRSFSSRLMSGSLYGAAGFFGGFGVGRAPQTDSFVVEIASWAVLGIFFGAICFFIGLFCSVRSSKFAIIAGLTLGVAAKIGQNLGTYSGSKKGKEYAEIMNRKERRRDQSQQEGVIPVGWVKNKKIREGVTFYSPSKWVIDKSNKEFDWLSTGQINSFDFSCVLIIVKDEQFFSVTAKEFATNINRERMLEGTKKVLTNPKILEFNNNYRWISGEAIYMKFVGYINGQKYNRLVVQTIYDSKMYAVILTVNEDSSKKVDVEINRFLKTFYFE